MSDTMNDDLTQFLNRWPYEVATNIRRVTGDDGKPKLQVRLPLGVEQYELEGRPDGGKPKDCESLLDYHAKALEQYRRQHGDDTGFTLSEQECSDLHEEGLLYYYRYLLCYQIGDYDLVKRDTERNMRLFRFVTQYAENDEDKRAMEQYWPYIIRMHASAGAFAALEEGERESAVALLHDAVQKITSLPEVDSAVFVHERERSLTVLNETIENIEKTRPLSKKEQLKKLLDMAVESENYERAARLRDIISRMNSQTL
jgi:hypothetical protein